MPRSLWQSLLGQTTLALPLLGLILLSPVVTADRLGEARLQLLLDGGIIALMAVSLAMVNGVTGQFSLGHAGFQALGGYGAAFLFFAVFSNTKGHFTNPDPLEGLSPVITRAMAWSAILTGGVFSAVTGVLVGLPTLRLRGDYLAIATLGFNSIVLVIIRGTESLAGVSVGGATGLSGLPRDLAGGFTDIFVTLWLAVLVLWRMVDSTYGRAFLAVCEDEVAAEASGVNTTRTKVTAFATGAFFAGVAGGLLAFKNTVVTPSMFSPEKSIDVVAMVILGGNTLVGSVLMAAALTYLINDVLDEYEKWRMPAYGFLLVVIMTSRVQPLTGLLFRRLSAAILGRAEPAANPTQALRVAKSTDVRPAADTVYPPAPPAVDDGSAALALIAQPADVGTEPLLQMCSAGVQFGGLKAVDALDLQIASGELVGLIGPNGAGKTTAFNLITGVYAPTEGMVKFRGVPLMHKRMNAVVAGGIARTFQNIRLFRNLSVLDNVRTAVGLRTRPSHWEAVLRTPSFYRGEAEVTELSRSLLRLFGLERFADKPAGSLSYGDQRRLEMARALATRPALLLLDEPAAGMNPVEKASLMELLRWVQSATRVSLLLIEHDMKVVMGVCRRITVLVYGRKIAEGTPEEIRHHPEVIAAYLGQPS